MCAAPLGRRPRPVADVPALDGRELARAWLVELVAAAPLERAAALPGPGFAHKAPRLCAAVAAAIASEPAFDDLEPAGALAPLTADAGVIAAADCAAETVAALDRLRKVIWAAILDEAHRPTPQQLAELADRLSAVVATVTAGAIEGSRALREATQPGDRGPLAAILRDEPDIPPSTAAVEYEAGFHSRVPPWTAAIERRLARHGEDGLPFAVLCVEVADLDRLVASERDGDVATALESAEAAVSAQLRPADALLRERPGRLWLVAPDTDREGARSLAHLAAAAVASITDHYGKPLDAAVGMATCPTDGADAPTLEGRAEEGLFAARAAGTRVAGPPRA